MQVKYNTTIVQRGNTTGIQVSEGILEQLNGGKKPLVKVTLNGYTYRSAVGKMDGEFMISLSAENRANANVQGGQTLEVILELDTEQRTVELPKELQDEFDNNEDAKSAFEKLAPSRKKAMVLSINEAKTDETRKKRIEKAINSLKN
ncbi:YdeI/OmpD-associated family protein [Chryseobacterium echinoideorum]|uniref:YdeI/OmpD-associated family protein n=1 Tax=Chryseobacterium echinoideorum TaxID=1549648 RepID=UPI001186717C|nr:YdeI/OmpD-associated family protein [Chryseobacterium echinoideorum]